MTDANASTTDFQAHDPNLINLSPVPEPIKPEGADDLPPVFKDEVREAIFAKRKQQLTDEMTAQGLEPQLQDEPVEKIIPEPKPEPKLEVKPLELAKTPEEEEFLLNVYGTEKKLSKDQMIREAQKGMAATQIYEEGYRMKEEALQIANSIKKNLQPQQVVKENPPQTQVSDKDRAREIAKRINYGSEEDQISALMEFGASIEAKVRGQAPALPPEQLVNAATAHTIAIIESRNEQDTLKREFADILADKPIASAADVIANELNERYRGQGIVKSRLELFREAGTLARERYLKPAAEAAPAQPIAAPALKIETSNDKIERKRAAPKPPVAANKVSAEPPPAYGVNVSSIVDKMRKARGQPVFN